MTKLVIYITLLVCLSWSVASQTFIDIDISTLTQDQGFSIQGFNQFGQTLSTVRDINGDGVDDFIVAQMFASSPGLSTNGIVYIIYGRKDGVFPNIDLETLTSEQGCKIIGAYDNGILGESIKSAGDVNGDGVYDIIIGSYAASPRADLEAAGIAYVIYGRKNNFPEKIDLATTDFTKKVGFSIIGPNSRAFLGDSVASAGDVNGDGIHDIIIGAPGATIIPGRENSGAAYIIYGSKTGLKNMDLSKGFNDAKKGFIIVGTEGIAPGYQVSSAGDINDDGFNDIIISDPFTGDGFNYGITYVIFGSNKIHSRIDLAESLSTNHRGFTIKIPQTNFLYFGFALASAGDVNGDGIYDILIGGAIGNTPSSGSRPTYVIYGKKEGFQDIDLQNGLAEGQGFKIIGAGPGEFYGFSVSSAGDVNADGIHDMILGATFADVNGVPNAGIVYVIYGNKSGFGTVLELGNSLDVSKGFRILGAGPGENLGNSVSSAGDINGDGSHDLLFTNKIGQAFVIFSPIPVGICTPTVK